MRQLRWAELTGKRGFCHAAVTRLGLRAETLLHRHDFHELFLVLEGSGWHQRGTERIPLRPGHLVFVRPEDAHRFATADGGLTFVNVAAPTPWIRNLAAVVELPPGWQDAGEPRGHVMLSGAPQSELHRLIFRLLEASAEPETPVLVWSHAARAAVPAPDVANLPPAWLVALHRDLQRPDWMGEPITFWQRRSGRSPEHLARSCRRYYGVPLNELINRARVARVQYLLQTTDEKVTTLAFAAGYNNLAHFYRVFERLAGQTPQAWRRRTANRLVPGSPS